MNIQTKRFYAFVIDFLIMLVLQIVLQIVFFPFIRDDFDLRGISFLYQYLFYFFNDVFFAGGSIGKKLMKMQIEIQLDSILKFAAIHAFFKFFAALFSWISGFYFLYKSRMPYDRFLYGKLE